METTALRSEESREGSFTVKFCPYKATNDPSVLCLKKDGCWLRPRHARCLLGCESVRLAPDSITGDFTVPGPKKVQVTMRGAIGAYSFDFPVWLSDDACVSHLVYLAQRIVAQWAPNALVLLLEAVRPESAARSAAERAPSMPTLPASPAPLYDVRASLREAFSRSEAPVASGCLVLVQYTTGLRLAISSDRYPYEYGDEYVDRDQPFEALQRYLSAGSFLKPSRQYIVRVAFDNVAGSEESDDLVFDDLAQVAGKSLVDCALVQDCSVVFESTRDEEDPSESDEGSDSDEERLCSYDGVAIPLRYLYARKAVVDYRRRWDLEAKKSLDARWNRFRQVCVMLGSMAPSVSAAKAAMVAAPPGGAMTALRGKKRPRRVV